MHSKKLLKLVTSLICLVMTIGAFAQNVTVKGTVKDASGPVVGAVVLSGGANAVTDVNGNYAITVPANAVLGVSCLGYATQNVNVNGRSVIDIVLSEDVEMLQEAVALGYGAQTKKKDLSASVGIVSNPEKLAGRPVKKLALRIVDYHALTGIGQDLDGRQYDGTGLLAAGCANDERMVVVGVHGELLFILEIQQRDAAVLTIVGPFPGESVRVDIEMGILLEQYIRAGKVRIVGTDHIFSP